MKDYTKALEFYDLAIKFSDDSLNTRIYLNNKAKVFHDDGKYDAALAIYNRLINETNKNRREYARVLTNIALSRSKQDTSYVAAPDLLTALRIRKEERDLWGQNSSYAHLSDYYKKSNSPDSALFYAMSMYDIAQQINSANDQISALQRLIRLAPVSRTKRYFEIYQPLRDSVELARNTAKNQFAVIRYEVEKSKAENLRLQRDNAEKAFQIDRQRTYTTIAVLFTLAVIAAAMYVYRKRQQRLQLEAENKIKAYQLNTSKKIHDVVANGLYRVMAEIEHQNDIDRDNILDRLESMYEKSRDISYETDAPPVKESDFKQKIASLLTSFATETTKVIISGNNAEFWSHVSSQARHELEHVLQELMVNMRKHSQATNVVVRFEQTGHQISIHYQDNGIGMPSAIFYGNGLSNTGNRIKSIGGLLTFDTEVKQGVRIHIALPVS